MNRMLPLLKVTKFRTSSLHTSALRLDGKNIVPKSTPEPKPDLGKDYMVPSGLDKVVLVWAKKYKSKAEIPNLVPVHLYNHARNIARIKFANYTIVAVIAGCIYSVYSGKREAERGNTLLKRSFDWHEELRKEHEEEQAALAKNKK